jgi:hypothetical protein
MSQSRLAEPIDKLAIALIIFFTLIMGLLVWGGSACDDQCLFRAGVRVNHFSWQNKTIGVQDRAFVLTFNHPMDRLSVEENLKITPSLPGKISWSGLRLAYTLEQPIPYGKTYQINLSVARDRFPNQERGGEKIQPFQAEFRSRDRALAYVGTQGEEQGRLVLFNWTRQQKTLLTPKNLAVFDFKPYPQGDLLLFSADTASQDVNGIRYLELYTVTTQLTSQNKSSSEVKLILDNQKYQNNKFDISQDGKTIVLQRLDRNNPSNYGLWKITDRSNEPQLITDAQVGDFLIAPDSQAIAVAKGEGIALLPLEPKAEPIDFLPKFGQILDFTADGTGAAMIDYNTDSQELQYTRSLYYVNNQGIQKELLNTDGSIQNCQFDSTAKHLYCWLTKLEKKEQYQEKPYLAQINLETGIIKTLVTIPQYQDSKVSVAPDEWGILFESSPQNVSAGSTNIPGEQKHSIWFLTLTDNFDNATTSNAKQLPFVGLHPQWLP